MRTWLSPCASFDLDQFNSIILKPTNTSSDPSRIEMLHTESFYGLKICVYCVVDVFALVVFVLLLFVFVVCFVLLKNNCSRTMNISSVKDHVLRRLHYIIRAFKLPCTDV